MSYRIKSGYLRGLGAPARCPAIPVASGLVLHLEPSYLLVYPDGTPIETWKDLSGNGRDVTNATASQRPFIKHNIVNSRPAMLFSDAQKLTGTQVTATSSTLYVVYKQIATAGYIFSYDNTVNNAMIVGFVANVENYDSPRISCGASDTSNFHIYTIFRDASISKTNTAKDGTAVTAATTGVKSISTTVIVGCSSAADFINGYIAELALFNKVLSGAEDTSMISYFKSKFAIP